MKFDIKKLALYLLIAAPFSLAAQERTGTNFGRDLSAAFNDNQSTETGSDFSPQIGAALHPALPMGEIAEVMSPGLISLVAFGDITLPPSLLKTRKFELRLGASFSYTSFSSDTSDFDASLGLIPAIGYARFAYVIRNRRSIGILRPYVQVGYGVTFATLTKTDAATNNTTNLSEFKGTLDFVGGVAWQPVSLPSLNIISGFHYRTIFDQSSQNFIFVSLGAAYRL